MSRIHAQIGTVKVARDGVEKVGHGMQKLDGKSEEGRLLHDVKRRI